MKSIWFKIIIVIFFLVSFIRISFVNLPWIYSSIGPDFTQVWISAKDLLAAKEPYMDPNLGYQNAYPPISEIFFLPFALLSHQVALVIFTYISFASIIGSVFLSLKIVMKKVRWYYFLLFIGLSFCSFPIRFSLGMGQINMIVLFLLLLSVYLETKQGSKSLPSGLLLGVVIALKPIFAFFLLFFALKKSWKVFFTSSLFVAVLIGITLIFWPLRIWISWYQSSIVSMLSYKAPYIYVYQNQGVFGFLSRLIPNFNLRIFLSRIATVVLVAIAIFLTFKNKEYNLGLSFFIITLLLFDITSWQHHFVWLMFPFVVFLNYIFEYKKVILLGLLILSYCLVSWNIKYDYIYPKIILSIQFYGTVILWAIGLYFFKYFQNASIKVKESSASYKFFDILKIR